MHNLSAIISMFETALQAHKTPGAKEAEGVVYELLGFLLCTIQYCHRKVRIDGKGNGASPDIEGSRSVRRSTILGRTRQFCGPFSTKKEPITQQHRVHRSCNRCSLRKLSNAERASTWHGSPRRLRKHDEKVLKGLAKIHTPNKQKMNFIGVTYASYQCSNEDV